MYNMDNIKHNIIINNNFEISKIIDEKLIPSFDEKRKNAEVSTPYNLRKDMIDKIPSSLWIEKNKIFEPCVGKGGFLIDIVCRLMDGLKDVITDNKERYKTIVEECLYFSDINEENINTCKSLIDPDNEYKLNYNIGDTLELNIKEKWGIEGFDAVIGNPPYNISCQVNTGNTLYQFFIKKSLQEWINENGYLVFVNPPSWRKPCRENCMNYGYYKLMSIDNQLLYLSIHNVIDGKKTFNCGTRYDWYVIKKTPSYQKSIINDEYNITCNIDMKKTDWLPNSNINEVLKIITNKNDNIGCFKEGVRYLKKSATDKTRHKFLSTEPTDYYCYKYVVSTAKRGIRYGYMCNKHISYGMPKIIAGRTGLQNSIVDFNGDYGAVSNCYYLKINSIEEGDNIIKAFKTEAFNKLLKSCMYSLYAIDNNFLNCLKKDFYKEFI